MALSDSFSSYPTQQFGLYCEWSASQNAYENYSSVTLDVYLSYYAIDVSAKANSTISINGNTETYTTPAIRDYSSGWKKRHLKSKTVKVEHDGNGNATINLSASWPFNGIYSGVSVGTITATSSVSLDSIDRSAPSVSISTSNVTPSAVTVSASASTVCDVWQYSTDGGGSWTQYSTDAATSTSVTITGLSPNTSYTVLVRARKRSNQVYGTSGGTAIKTLGPAVLNSVSAMTVDGPTASFTFNWTIYSTEFTYSLALLDGSTTLLTASIPAQPGTGAQSKTITLSEDQRVTILSHMADMKSFSGTYVLTTYSGTVQIGDVSSSTAAVQTTSENSAPVFPGFAYADSNTATAAITLNNQLFIKGHSRLFVTATEAVPKNFAAIKQYEATIDGTTVKSSATTLSVGTLNTAGNLQLTVKAIDSRGYETSVTKSVTVIDYEKISVASCTMRRTNEVEALTQVSFEADISRILVDGANKNELSALQYQYKKTSDTDYGEYVSVTAQASVTDTNVTLSSNDLVSLESDYSYDVRFVVSDLLTTDYITVTLPPGIPLLSKRRKKLGINNRRPQAALDVVGGVKIDNLEGVLKATNGRIEIAEAGTDYAEIPADFVVEQGTSGIWTYRKWNSGVVDCWALDMAATISPGDNLKYPALPFTFADANYTLNGSLVSDENQVGFADVALQFSQRTITGFCYDLYNRGVNSPWLQLSIEVHGYWR